MTSIAIIGAGNAALHLGLCLLRHGITPTIYTDRTPEEVRAGRLLNTTALLPTTRDLDTSLGVNRWPESYLDLHSTQIWVHEQPALSFTGHFERHCLFIDMRMYLPTLMNDFKERGGKMVVAKVDRDQVEQLAMEHDLVVVATGRAGLTEMFPRNPELSPYTSPQRLLLAGLFEGVQMPDRGQFVYHLVPEVGEILEFQMHAPNGPATGLLFEAIPGGKMEKVARLRYDDDPVGFNNAILDILEEYGTRTFARVDRSKFRLLGPLDVLSGAVTPVVRRAYTSLRSGRFVMALGDAQTLVDPVVGYGANLATQSAWLFADSLVNQIQSGGVFDEAFFARAEQRIVQNAIPYVAWINAFLQPPPPHALELFAAASKNQAIADTVMNNFMKPQLLLEALASPDHTAAFIRSFSPSPALS